VLSRLASAKTRFILSSFTFRLALLYVLLLGASVAILLGFIYWSTAGYMTRQIDATIGAEIQGLAEQYRRRGINGLSSLISERIARDPAGAGVYLLTDSDLQPVIGNLDAWPRAEPDRDGWIDFRLREERAGDDGVELREHAARAKVFRLRGGLRLLVGRDVRELTATRRLIQDALGWGLAITAALALLGGWLLSAGVVRRLEGINQVSREIMEGDLSRRVPTNGSDDELDRLAVNLNRMLERIETLMASVRQVSDNIAHDLRTPLSRLHTKLAELRDAGLSDALAVRVEAAMSDAEELLGAFSALLRIARVESGSRRAAFADLDLSPLLLNVAELYEPLATDRLQALEVLPPAPGDAGEGAARGRLQVHGDRDLLFQAIANLLDNAIKYTPPGGRIRLDAERRGASVVVRVSDSGPGIPAALRDKVLQRFYRVDQSRSAPGHGLGLSLVRAVAQLHGAELELEDAAPGLRVTLRLPVHADGQRPSAQGGQTSAS
jgi:signal transduction histidine kinase